RAQIGGAEEDEGFAAAEYRLEIAAGGIDPEFEVAARHVDGAGDRPFGGDLGAVAQIDEDGVGIAEASARLGGRQSRHPRAGAVDEGVDRLDGFRHRGSPYSGRMRPIPRATARW